MVEPDTVEVVDLGTEVEVATVEEVVGQRTVEGTAPERGRTVVEEAKVEATAVSHTGVVEEEEASTVEAAVVEDPTSELG